MQHRIIFFALILSIFLAGCSAFQTPTEETTEETVLLAGFGYSLYDENIKNGVEMEDFSDNQDIQYIRWAYNGNHTNDAISRGWWMDSHNLTNTEEQQTTFGAMQGHQIIQSMEEYNAVIDAIEEKKQAVIDEIGVFQDPVVLVDTMESEINEAFFEEHNLVMADYCGAGSTHLRTRLDKVSTPFWSRTAKITISKEEMYASTADLPGEIYWIPVPERCTEVEITYVETAWNR